MSDPFRVLIVDDAAPVRRLVGQALAADSAFEVVGIAQNGRIALAKALLHRPDLVVLDVEMPIMDGLATLDAFRERQVKSTVVMFSSLTQRGAEIALDAMARGAADCVLKPQAKSLKDATDRIRNELLPVLRELGEARRRHGARDCPVPPGRRVPGPRPTKAGEVVVPLGRTAPANDARRSETARVQRSGAGIEAVAIGVSTGGPTALVEVVPQLSAALPVPVLIVQHMPPMFTRLLAERLDAQSAIRVVEAEDGMRLEGGWVYVAPGGRHMAVRSGANGPAIALNDDPPENSCRPAVDVLFRSASRAYGNRCLGVVMTGMGRDGTAGARALVREGAQVLTQDADSCVVWGMPRHVEAEDLSAATVPLARIAAEIEARVTHSARARRVVS